jgi:putative transposase
MPRRARCVLPGVPYHVTQRGVDRQATFSLDEDRHTYLRLLRENLSEADVRVWGWCLMSNHVHLVLLPGREDSLSLLMRRVHGRYAQYYNTRWGRTGHLWQNRFFSCILGIEHLWAALHTWSGIQSEPALSIPPPSIRGQAPLPTLSV